jgi:pimeloyl-ACP methyl ester carboxylesterase
MSHLPTLVFVPGAWHKPTCYGKIIKLLQEQHSLKCIPVTLPSTTGNPAATFKDDLDAAREAISSETSHGRDVVVIAHSYGGMVGNSAVKGFTKPQDIVASGSTSAQDIDQPPRPTTGYVIGIILIASGFTLTGLSFMDPFFGHPPPSWRVNAETGYADIVIPTRDFFYHDLPADEADYWSSELTTQSLKALFEGGEYSYAGWMDVPSWYIGTVQDHGLPVVAQRMSVGMAREMSGRVVEHRELQTSHSPFLSQPEETAAIVVEAVGAFTGKPVENTSTTTGRGNAIILPAARLWQPVTWYRYGLPLIFGHIIGRGVLFFGWSQRLWRSWRR